jgi:hypothetical protein
MTRIPVNRAATGHTCERQGETVVGFNDTVRDVLLHVDLENIELEELATWGNEEVDDLVRSLRKQKDADDNALYVSVKAVENLKTVCYVLRHQLRTEMTLAYTTFTTPKLLTWKAERKAEEAYKEPEEAPKLVKADEQTILIFIDEFPEHLARYTGSQGRPLAYVIRDEEATPAENDDPMFGEANSTYLSVRDEVINRALILQTSTNFKADNKKVFEILYDAIGDHEDVKVWLKGHVRSKNGCEAWKAFKAHYYGGSQLDSIANRADDKIESLVYSGERQRYTFETHISHFKKAHLDLEKATGSPVDERTKVRQFLKSTKAPGLETSVSVVQSQDSYLKSFEETINYLRRFISKLPTQNRSVAAIQSMDKAPAKPHGLEYRWYKKEEWAELPEDHKVWLRA